MSEWVVDIQNMIPVGECGERMLVVRVDRTSNKFDVMCAPVMKTHDASYAIGDDEIFMRSFGITSGFGKGEIDQFLQAMMDAGWKRGLRPVGFDPSAGELAAVNRHLEDLRNIVMVKVEANPVIIGKAPGPIPMSEPNDPKKW